MFNLFALEEAARECAGMVEDRLARRRLHDDARNVARSPAPASPTAAAVRSMRRAPAGSLARRLRRYLGIPTLRAGYRTAAVWGVPPSHPR